MEGSAKRRKVGTVGGATTKARRRKVGPRRRIPVRARDFGLMAQRATNARMRAVANTRTAGFLGLEKKFYDTAISASSIAASTDATGGALDPATVACLSAPAQGDTEQSRDGKRIVIKSVQVHGIVTTDRAELAGDPCPPLTVFVALVQDTQTNASVINSGDVFKNLGATTVTGVVPLRNLLYASRFKVLKSQTFQLDPPTLSHVAADSFSVNGVGQTFNWYLPCEIPVNFNSVTAAGYSGVVDNSLHVIAYCTSTLFSPRLQYNARIRFMG